MTAPQRKTPPGKGGARDSVGGWSRFADSFVSRRAQCLALALAFGPELVLLLVLLAIGGAS